ncbi:PREDICTED: synaptonemal complex protein 2 [Miniopterus natalensis]|uniref:synaptonemal complex protein 2 n=1 Tax=Miniopterus natalensis TaxID=291302 RepID=UPI0007A6D741|nr:PREDICTED: synaptonemal complex protein 2 [Miniopterus natalensis]
MPIRPDLQQLEKCVDDALRKNDFKPLKTLLQIDICEDVKIKCSKQFFHKLDDLICRELNKKDIQTVSIILISFGRCSRNISILGQVGLLTLIKQGLVQKMVAWFEKSKEIILSRGNSKDEAVINMIEDLFDLLMVIYGVNDEGKKQVVESFIPRVCALIIDSRVNICIQQETLKKMNAMLDKIPQDARKILYNQEMLILMNSMGERILDAGDYDLQVGIVEALCRMTTEKQRRKLACQWFSMDFIANAFKGIKDSEFETAFIPLLPIFLGYAYKHDCRIFLNLVNGMLGDKRRVFTFPCLSAFLDKYELQIPSDEKLEEFWIDFNLGSQTLSFYIAGDDDHQWEAVTVPEEEVQIYNIEERESKKLLTIILKTILRISNREGKELLLYFDASLEITNVTQKIFGANKHREFTRKQGISVARTSVHILFDASGSQILVPESQISPVAEELVSLKEKPNSQKEFAKPPEYIKNSTQGSRKNSQSEIITPSKRKMSEASILVTGAEIYNKRSPLHLTNTSTSGRGKRKPLLQVRSSAGKPGVPETAPADVDAALPHAGRRRGEETRKHITANIAEKTENKNTEFLIQNFNESQYIPDSQAVGKIDKSVLPGVSYNIRGNKTPSKLACWTPVTNIKLCNNQRASTSQGDTFNQDIAINKTVTKQKSSSSASDDNFEEIGKVEYKKEIMQCNKIDKAEVDVCKRNKQQLNQHSEMKNIENTKQSDWHIESETTFKSILLNKTVEESLIYRKKYILSKDVNTAICDKSPSPSKNAKSSRKSRKRLMSELNSWDLKQKKMREKSKGKALTDAAKSLISQINKRYKPKGDIQSTRKLKESLINSDFSNKSDLQLSKEKGQKKSYRQLKTTFVNVTSEHPLNDVYNFNLNGADEPIIKLGIQEFQATAREACMDSSIKSFGLMSHDELEPSLKTKEKRIVTSHKNKNLFSDTDTEYRYDDGKTDISWLREPKSKPQLIEYSRNKSVKKKQKSGKSRPSLEREQPRSKMTPKKTTTKKVDETIPDGRTRLPRRVANTKKNYKDLSNSESECEQEVSESLKEKLLVKEENIHARSKTMKLPKKQQNAFSSETQKDISKEWASSSLLKNTTIRDNSLDLSPVSLSGSPSSIEVMRSTEKITERDFTQDHDCITKSISPTVKSSSPESFNSKYGVGGPIKSLKNSEKNLLCARESCSPMPQSFSSESHSASSLSTSSEKGEKIRCDTPCDSTHVSGPTYHLSRKRMYIEDINPNEVGLEEEEEGRADLLPPKLSKMENADHHSHKMSESTSPLSTNDFSVPGKNWGTEISDVGTMCEQFNTEFKKKFNIHHKLMDYFTKQSWKTAQQHLKTMNHHIQEYRIKKLDKFQFSIIKELENFEKDSQSLKDLEKEFTDFGEKIVQKFSAYQKSEQERLHLLKASLDKNVFYSTDREETICTSEMCFMKENMKILQDRLLKEMQEEELLNVRRGLLSLFMACETNVNVEI